MQFSQDGNSGRWFIIALSFAIVLLILWNTFTFFQIFKKEEQLKVSLWADAQKVLINANETTDVELPLKIFSANTSIPIILTENDQIINAVNISEEIIKDSLKASDFLNRLKNENQPIAIEVGPGQVQYLYYGNSDLLTRLKYFPIALVMVIVLFSVLVFNFYQSTKIASQNRLWAGMAKETAHQIGTPLSSLMGWVAILKTENVPESYTQEIEKDIERLKKITDRFSKIGSVPLLENVDITQQTLEAYNYLKSRLSKQVSFEFVPPFSPVRVSINPTLHAWTIENLVKNAIDAMKGQGNLKLEIVEEVDVVLINITDTGKGIPKSNFNAVFEPGFTTKKRGWGLGLSLSKRIVEEYHNGFIKIVWSEVGVGSTLQIVYKKEL